MRDKIPPENPSSLWRGLAEDTMADRSQSFHGLNRREFLRLMGASLAMATTVSCRNIQPPEGIIPYNKTPVEEVPGIPRYFATAMPLGGFGIGVLAENHTGRPTRVEGNPMHPSSLGGADAFLQGSILQLYDPDRKRKVTFKERYNVKPWEELKDSLLQRLNHQATNKGKGLHILSETITSPTLAWQMREFHKTFPEAQWHQYEPVTQDNQRKGARKAFGRILDTLYHPEKAKIIVSFDEDFLGTSPGRLAYARNFAHRKKVDLDSPDLSRLFCAEPSFSITGGIADTRWPLSIKEVEHLLFALAHELGVIEVKAPLPLQKKKEREAFQKMVDELKKHKGESLVMAGNSLSPTAHHVAHLINSHLRSDGHTLSYVEPIAAKPVLQIESLKALSDKLKSNEVDTLIILGGNPAFTAPADMNFKKWLKQSPYTVHLSPYWNETSKLATWHIPESHYLESWGDIRAHDGTATIIQPQIRPLHQSRSAWEIVDLIIGESERSPYEIIKDYWIKHSQAIGNETKWRQALHDGVIPNTEAQRIHPKIQSLKKGFSTDEPKGFEISFRPDPRIWDGRFANNAWLQELPKPHSKIVWDNALLIHPLEAEKLGLSNGDIVELAHNKWKTLVAIWKMPGQAKKSLTFHLGYGSEQPGRVAKGTGFNAFPIRPASGMWAVEDVQIKKTGKTYAIATTQSHDEIEPERSLAISWTVDEVKRKKHHLLDHLSEHQPEYGYKEQIRDSGPDLRDAEYAWGMVIDLNSCIGCGACTIACQSENNIPVVGKKGVLMSREMHWIRVDRYFKGGVDSPEAIFQPVPCMHCEKAPCEVVCPVAATVHNEEGLNEMIYNRCVGTRYCSNNCPYKVRRFNFQNYANYSEPLLQMFQNPDVTVRARGVMEKCTYCVQRINRARISAQNENRPIHDGEIVMACQSACPTEAIQFGDIKDSDTKVSQWKRSKRHYGILTELGTHPRTTYLTKITHPVHATHKQQEGLHDK